MLAQILVELGHIELTDLWWIEVTSNPTLPQTIQRSKGKAQRVIDKQKL
jgi:hypothetical protein